MGASLTALKQLDQVQHRALHIIGPGVYTDSLHHRRKIAALCYMYKLHYLPDDSPLTIMRPRLAAPRDETATRLSAADRHPWQLAIGLPARTRNSHLRSFPAGITKEWNNLPPGTMQQPPCAKGLQTFKTRVHRHLQRHNWLDATDYL